MSAFGGVDGPSDPNAAILGPQDIARDENGPIPGARQRSPWRDEQVADDESQFLAQWVKVWPVDEPGRPAFVQWFDTGPYEEQDYEYVFGDGTQRPANEANRSSENLGAGIDFSPAAAIYLGAAGGSGTFSWSFIDAADVPDGPWKVYPAIDNKPDWE